MPTPRLFLVPRKKSAISRPSNLNYRPHGWRLPTPVLPSTASISRLDQLRAQRPDEAAYIDSLIEQMMHAYRVNGAERRTTDRRATIEAGWKGRR